MYANLELEKNSALGTVRVWGDKSGNSSLTYGIRWNMFPYARVSLTSTQDLSYYECI